MGIELRLISFDANERSHPDHPNVFDVCLLVVKILVRCDVLQCRVWSSVGEVSRGLHPYTPQELG